MSERNDSERQHWLEHLAIQDLIYRYSDAVTRGDYDQVATVFAASAVWEAPLLGLRFESAQAFVDFLIEGSPSLAVLIQTAHSPVIEVLDTERARATTTIHEMFLGSTPMDTIYGDAGVEVNIDQYGIYHDDVSKADGEWKFTHRCFVPFLVANGGVVGDVVSKRPLLRTG
jgi:hypothetical protein